MKREIQQRAAARWVGSVALCAILAGCAPIAAPATDAAGNAAADAAVAHVYFAGPADGATVAAPVKVTMAADNFVVEPAGEVKAGAGHLHIMVDVPCVAAGQGVPKDESHLHFGQGQMEAELALAPGPHTLCLQAADGNHVALDGDGMTQMLNITVE